VSSDIGDTKPNMNETEALQTFRQALLCVGGNVRHNHCLPVSRLVLKTDLSASTPIFCLYLNFPQMQDTSRRRWSAVRALQADQLQVAEHFLRK